MSNYINSLILAVLTLASSVALAQNLPNNSSLPSGAGAGQVNYPLNFNQSPNVAPAASSFVKESYPSSASATLPSNVRTKTVYLNGWNKPLMSVDRYGGPKSIVTPYDLRTSDTSLSFLPYAESGSPALYNDVYTRQKNYYNTNFAAENATAYSATMNYSILGAPYSKNLLPGRAFVGENKSTSTALSYNVANDILIVTFSGTQVCESGTYAANQLTCVTTVGQHNQQTKVYTDKNGRLICKQVFAGGTNWLSTYYVYDDLGRLTVIVPPKASVTLLTQSCLSQYRPLCFVYKYDAYGNVINKNIPGRDDTDIVIYDLKMRPVLFQSPNLRDSSKIRFVIYDNLGRAVIGGYYKGTETIYYWRNIANGTGSAVTHLVGGVPVAATGTLEHYVKNSFSGSSYPSDLFGCEIYFYNYYDDYAIAPATASFAANFSSYYESLGNSERPEALMHAHGKLVANKVRTVSKGIRNNFTNTPWVTNLYFYDKKSRLIQVQTQNPWNKWDTITHQYNFLDQPIRKIESYHAWTSARKPNTRIITKYSYDANSQLPTRTDQKIDTFGWQILASYDYNELGQLRRQKLGLVEQQNYTYNIRGQLKGINAADLRSVSLPDDVSYASELRYETGFSIPRYDGGLSGYKWRSKSSQVRAYGYEFDDAGRMTVATYRDSSSIGGGGATWNNTNRDFTVSALAYDDNGNITHMNQRGYDTVLAPATIDNLSYTYNNNRLTKVTDAGVKSLINDFDNGTSGTLVDYTYDGNGNIISDKNKSIFYKYDESDRPLRTMNAADTFEYIYDGFGTLIEKRTIESGDSVYYRYQGPLVFKNDTLHYVLNEKGRSRWVKDSLFFKHDVFVQDHQGNVRTVITAQEMTGIAAHAGFEMSAAYAEESMFSHVADIRDYSPTGTPYDLMSGLLNGSTNRIGTAILVHVMAGDQINMKSYGYYETLDTGAFNTYATPSTMASSLITALTTGSLIAGEGGLVGSTTVNNLLSTENYAAYDALKNATVDRNFPRMYLNYLVFDEEMHLLPEECQVAQLKVGKNIWGMLEAPVSVTRHNGYVLAYISNESAVPTYIDNTYFTITQGLLQQEQHYYPHGLVIEGGIQTGALPCAYLFEGNELQKNQLSDFHNRQYDQQIGRFINVDPLADQLGQEMFSPYHFVQNDPANFTDPFGLAIGDVHTNPDGRQWKETVNGAEALDVSECVADRVVTIMGDHSWSGEGRTISWGMGTGTRASGGGSASMSTTGFRLMTIAPQPAKTKAQLEQDQRDKAVAQLQIQTLQIASIINERISHQLDIQLMAALLGLSYLDNALDLKTGYPVKAGYILTSSWPHDPTIAISRRPEFFPKAKHIYGILDVDDILQASGNRSGSGQFGAFSNFLGALEGVAGFADNVHYATDKYLLSNHGDLHISPTLMQEFYDSTISTDKKGLVSKTKWYNLKKK